MNTFSTEERNALIINNVSLAEKIAFSKKKKLTHISLEELKSAAYLGLVEAASNYNPNKNNCFPAFAVWRIIGAIRDYLREISWCKRSKYFKVVQIEKFDYLF
jgi:RNA polymerase sigma factor FliA